MMIFELGKDKKMIILETLKIKKKWMIFAERGDDFLIISKRTRDNFSIGDKIIFG